MKVPYFDIRSHFLLWMILSKVFSMYINADRHWHSQSAMVITEARRTGGKYASITGSFSSPSPFSFLLVGGALARENEGALET